MRFMVIVKATKDSEAGKMPKEDMLAAIDLKQLGTVLVGEPSGGIPNGFGDVHTFNLPNAGWRFQVSTKTFRFPAYDNADTVRPDILVDFAIQDYADQTDPYLEAILKQ